MDVPVKQENLEASLTPRPNRVNDGISKAFAALIELSSSSSSSSSESEFDSDESDVGENRCDAISDGGSKKKRRKLDDELGVVLPLGFLAPLPPAPPPAVPLATTLNGNIKQFWKAGDYEGAPCGDWDASSGSMDHVRVHPKFLHSNATSHKWALGAFAELLDNSLDEVCNGATYVNIDMLENRKDGSRMLLIEDNGGGMDPDKMRQCMSLGYSAKSKLANTIGQYGNGFKTSTMRLGADVLVFSLCCGKDGKRPTQSIGLLSYTFLRSTGKEDIVVPMLDYEKDGRVWNKMIRSSPGDWNTNIETIVQWSPFSSEAELLRQFNVMSDHGTRIIIYDLWEDDQGLLELDFDTDPQDIQLRGVNRDERNIQMAKEYPNSRHFLTYRHSLRSYASILYLRLPPGFRIILRGKDVEHHNIVNDMMMSQEITYRPQAGADGIIKDSNIAAVVTIGFVKDAKYHIDVQGFNVYHKNRLIKPFWRLWNAAGSDGRGVIGVLEANFVEPAHDKQGFERTTVLARLETRLVQMQKAYWSTYCHKIGYAPRRNKKLIESPERETSPDYHPHTSQAKRNNSASGSKSSPYSEKFSSRSNGNKSSKGNDKTKPPYRSRRIPASSELLSPPVEYVSDDDLCVLPGKGLNGTTQKNSVAVKSFEKVGTRTSRSSAHYEEVDFGDRNQQSNMQIIDKLKQENRELQERLKKRERDIESASMRDLQCEKCQSFELQLQEARQKIEELNKEQESLIDIFSEERDRRDKEEDNLRKKLKDASNTIQDLLDKVRLLEKMKSPKYKAERNGT